MFWDSKDLELLRGIVAMLCEFSLLNNYQKFWYHHSLFSLNYKVYYLELKLILIRNPSNEWYSKHSLPSALMYLKVTRSKRLLNCVDSLRLIKNLLCLCCHLSSTEFLKYNQFSKSCWDEEYKDVVYVLCDSRRIFLRNLPCKIL